MREWDFSPSHMLKGGKLKQGDEVIAPALTFIAPINAIKYNGANPIFMDSGDIITLIQRKLSNLLRRKLPLKIIIPIIKLLGKNICFDSCTCMG